MRGMDERQQEPFILLVPSVENIVQCRLVLYSQVLVTLLKNYVFQTIQNKNFKFQNKIIHYLNLSVCSSILI